MDTLNLRHPPDPQQVKVSPALPGPAREKSAGMAFFLSLLLPGLGQVYCGKVLRGVVTLAAWVAAGATIVLLAMWGELESGGAGEMFLGVAFRAVLFLYPFAFLDAYFTAREINDGTDAVMQYNPRVAAILNLLTRGFGYWYLDEKTKGVVVFIIVGIAYGVGRFLGDDPWALWLSVLIELAQVAMAVHAYRLACYENALLLERWPVTMRELRSASGFGPGVPVALAGLFGLAYILVVGVALYLPDYEKIDHSQATITPVGGGKEYRNPKYQVAVVIPADWEFSQHTPPLMFDAWSADRACNVELRIEAAFPFFSDEFALEMIIGDDETEVKTIRETTLAGLPARTAVSDISLIPDEEEMDAAETPADNTQSEESKLSLRYFVTHSGRTRYFLAEMTNGDGATCQAAYQEIRSRLTLKAPEEGRP